MRDFIQHLVHENLTEIAAKSLLDCHVRGLHSIMLLDSPEQRVRLFVATERHELYKNSSTSLGSLAAHAHHCNLTLHCVRGMFKQIEYYQNLRGSFKAYRYQSALLTGVGGFKREHDGAAVSLNRAYWVRAGESIRLPASLVHSVYVPAHTPAAWLVYEGKEDPSYASLSYSDQDLEQAKFQGLYGKMTEAQVISLLQFADLLSGAAFEYLTLSEPLPPVTPCPSGRNDCPSGCDKCPAECLAPAATPTIQGTPPL